MNDEQMTLAERIRTTLRLGESHFREFKTAWERSEITPKPRDPKLICRDIAETLVAFANADGGELIVGAEDDGTLTGVPHAPDAVDFMLAAPATYVFSETPLSGPTCLALNLDSNQILYFSISRGTQHVHLTSNGRCLRRFDKESRPVSAEHIQYARAEQTSQQYDREFVDGATASDLDEDLIRNVGERIGLRASIEKTLQYLGLAEFVFGSLRLRKAALLLFARDASRWHPRMQVRILRVAGSAIGSGQDYNVPRDDIFRGNVMELLDRAWDQLKPFLAETKFGPESLFQESVIYPEEACREALINAVAHRDYAVEGRGIEVTIFDDRMEIASPGGLLSSLSLDDLVGLTRAHQTRNAYVARVLREVGYMREMGEGIPRIFNAMKRKDLVAPEISTERGNFNITLHHRSIYSSRDEEWLKTYRAFPLSRNEQKVLLLGSDQHLVSPQEIWDTLELVDTDDLRKVVESLLSKGLIVSTLTQAQVTKQARRHSRRDVGRYKVRSADEAESSLAELVAAIREVGPFGTWSIDYEHLVLDRLASGSPFRSHLRWSFRYLGLVDDDGRPLPATASLWVGRITPIKSQASTMKSGTLRNIPIATESAPGAAQDRPARLRSPKGTSIQDASCTFCERSTSQRIGLTSEQRAGKESVWERWVLPLCSQCLQSLPPNGITRATRIWYLGHSVGPDSIGPARTSLESPMK